MNTNVFENGKTEIWTNEQHFFEDVLEPMGEADYDTIEKALEDGKTVTHRYIVEYYRGNGHTSTRIRYSQMFIDGVNVGYYEDHPYVEIITLEDGRKVFDRRTIYYDLELKTVEGRFPIKRFGSLNVWVKRQ